MIQANHHDNGDDGITEMPGPRDDARFFGFQDEEPPVRAPGETFDLSGVIQVMPAWRPIPPIGWVRVLIGKCEVRTPQVGGTKYLHLRYQVPQEFTTPAGVKVSRGASATQNLQIWHTSPQASQASCRILSYIAQACGAKLEPTRFSPLDFVGRELEIRVGEQPDFRDQTKMVPKVMGHRALPPEGRP